MQIHDRGNVLSCAVLGTAEFIESSRTIMAFRYDLRWLMPPQIMIESVVIKFAIDYTSSSAGEVRKPS